MGLFRLLDSSGLALSDRYAEFSLDVLVEMGMQIDGSRDSSAPRQ